MHGSSYGYGIPGVAVKTTIEALKRLGWESDYEKYDKKISIKCSMHCDRRITSNGLSRNSKGR